MTSDLTAEDAETQRAAEEMCGSFLPPSLCGPLRLCALCGKKNRRGFVLFEAVLAVLLFSIGIVALGRCVENCLSANLVQEEDARVRRLLLNRMLMVQAGAVPLSKTATDVFKEGIFSGITLKMTSEPLREKNEKGQDVSGIFHIVLVATWESRGEKQSREVFFYHTPRTN